MKAKYYSLTGILIVLVLIASFIVPASPEPVAANPGLMEWTPVDTPDIEVAQVKSLFSPVQGGIERGSEIVKMLVGNNGTTMYTVISQEGIGGTPAVINRALYSAVRLLKSIDGGRSWSDTIYNNLVATMGAPANTLIIWDIALAPDNPNIFIAAVSLVANLGGGGATAGPDQQVWVTSDGGANWENTQWPPPTQLPPVPSFISTLDISMDYGARDLLVGVRAGNDTAGLNKLWTMKMPGYGGWNVQNGNGAPASVNAFDGDIIVAKFSPTYNGDSTIAVVYSANTAPTVGTFLVAGVHDVARNLTTWQVAGTHVEIKNSTAPSGSSPTHAQIITADLEMPSDFSGQSASLRRFYVSTDDNRANGANNNRGVYRIDDNTVYTLMDNSTTFFTAAANTANRRIASIAYWGTYASGKLLVGERLGKACTAMVPVWFTDSPTVCPIPCWYPAKKPPTGAAGQNVCTAATSGFGNAWVVWSPTFAAQGVAYTTTGSMSYDGGWANAITQANAQLNWPGGIFNVVALDESAFSLTRNNGETWNQLSLIDTRMNKLTDVAPSADCTTVYLASVNNGVQCRGFDSVWRSSTNEKVVAPPLPALPIGQYWERVLTRITALDCTQAQSNYSILRLAPDKTDGQVVGWAAGGTSGLGLIGNFTVGANQRVLAWSPDFGDYWADVNPRIAVQDFAFETSTILYVISNANQIQKLPYTGTAWSSAVNTVDTVVAGHTVEVMAPDKVLVGGAVAGGPPFAAAISTNGGGAFTPMVRPVTPAAAIGYHAIFDTDFLNNNKIYIGVDSATGLVYRNDAPGGANIDWSDICTGFGVPPHDEFYGLIQTNNKNVIGQGALYAAHAPYGANTYSGVCRTLAPLDGVPKPGVWWECLDAAVSPFQVNTPVFTLEPKSLKFCGCLTQETYTKLYAIDNDVYSNNQNVARGVAANVRTTGLLWEYTDCMAKQGPKLSLDDGAIIGCDPATGRNQEINFRWEQLCVANIYNLLIAKDNAFALTIWGLAPGGAAIAISPPSVTSPALVYMSGGGTTFPATAAISVPELECGHTYFWKVRVANETTNDAVISPWSEVRSFTIKAGFRVTTPYYGPQLLTPDNGYGCPCDSPFSFSWSPFKETTAYRIQISASPDMSALLEEESNVTTTAYLAKKAKFECGKTYFWRVMAVKPAPSEWSATFIFSIQPRPAAPPKPSEPKEPTTPLWAWTLIAIGTILVVVTLILVVTTRKR